MVRLENIPAEIRVFIMSLSNYILFFSLFIVYFISNSLSIITPLYLSHIGLELYIVGGIVSVAPLFRFLLLATLYGRVMERVPAGVLYKLSVVAVAASTALLVVKNPFAIAVSRIVAGVFGTFLMPLLWNSVASSAKMISYANSVTVFAGIVSFAAAGLVVGAVGFEVAFLFFALLLLSTVFAKASAGGGGLKLGEVLRRSPVAPLLAIFLEWYVLYSLFLLLPIFLNKQGFSTDLIGLFFTVEAAVYGALQPLVGRLVEGNRRELVLLLALYPSSLLLIPLAPGLVPLVLILFAVGSSPIFVITTHYWRRGGFDMGVLMAFGYLGSFTGPLISGLLAQLSYILSFLQLAIAGGILAIIIIKMFKN